MKNVVLNFFLFFSLCAINGQSNSDIVIGHIDSISSEILGEEREIWIHVPADFSDGLYEATDYPVVYLLDGSAHFHSVVGMIQQLSSVNGNTICPKMIVVGITNTNRTRDLTPTKAEPDPFFVDSIMAANSGGGDAFMRFIEKELFPYVDSNYPTEPYRMLIGHSFGGLTVMNTLIHKPELFNSYVAIDPSMWWDDSSLLKELKSAEMKDKYKSESLFLAIANTMSPDMDTLRIQTDTTSSTKHMRSILELNSTLSSVSEKHISYKGKYYEDDNHGSVPFIAEYDALRFIFEFYQLEFEADDYMNPESDFVNKVEEHYKRLSNVFGIEKKPDEEFVNGLGYQFMSMQQFEKAELFFKMNVRNYPKSFNVYDSLGDLYVEIEDDEKAIENFKQSVALNKDSVSKEKLRLLQRK